VNNPLTKSQPERSDPTARGVSLTNDDAFDNIIRSAGATISRRDSIRVALSGFAALVMWRSGIRDASAQVTDCLCNGQTYKPATQCCISIDEGDFVVQKNPIANLSQCPDRVAHPGHTCLPDGCGSATDGSNQWVPNSFLGAPFGGCCNNHDCCYDRCNSTKSTCDTTFGGCLLSSCASTFSSIPVLAAECAAVSGIYYSAVALTTNGQNAFGASQQLSCDCCGTAPCMQTCQGGNCGAFSSCNNDCGVCFQSTDGSGACSPGDNPCTTYQTCNSQSDCPSGSACTPNTCCGPQGICQPICSGVSPAPPASAVVSKLRRNVQRSAAKVLTPSGYR
jgi:group XII secretory phospholipase A2 precursor (PLA2G12)